MLVNTELHHGRGHQWMGRSIPEKKVKPWVGERPMKDANQAIVDMDEGKVRYRYVLKNDMS